ncbi:MULTISPECIES: hypothetical protein [unclassified Microcoleus]|uniref:hypothetical protein n=1 Tax=unclassified Microcoleus TaxID=2642155 RepID=UPI002FD0FC30
MGDEPVLVFATQVPEPDSQEENNKFMLVLFSFPARLARFRMVATTCFVLKHKNHVSIGGKTWFVEGLFKIAI